MALKVKDIAKMLNISPATVSLVLNNKPGVGEETRHRILKVVEEMGYTTNMLSKPALKNNQTIRFIIYKKHGKVVADTPFFSALVEGIEQEARNSGYNLMVSYINEYEKNKAEVYRILAESSPDGILLLATEMTAEDLQDFKNLNLPLVIMDNHFPLEKVDSVTINNLESACEAVNYLIGMGHTDIGYLHSSIFINNFEERKQGVIKALNDSNLKINNKNIYTLDSTLKGAYSDMVEILNRDTSYQTAFPTAFFADNDIIASGAIKALKEKGLRIPQDVSIVGFDDMPLCEFIDPPLSTVKVFKHRLGMLAIKRLVERINGNTPETVHIQVGSVIVERKSTRQKCIENKKIV